MPHDIVVDAVLPGPGVRHRAPTAARGHTAWIEDGTRENRPRQARDRRRRRGFVPGLDDGSAVLRIGSSRSADEDAVIGNDTLSRTLHPGTDRWARRDRRAACPGRGSP